MKNLILFAALVIFTGCVTSSHKVTGTLRPAVAPDSVQVYHSMPANAQVIGLVSADSYSGIDFDQASANAIIQLQTQAGKLGANGVVINSSQNKPLQGSRFTGQAVYIEPQ